jgi:hypothetical protein
MLLASFPRGEGELREREMSIEVFGGRLMVMSEFQIARSTKFIKNPEFAPIVHTIGEGLKLLSQKDSLPFTRSY